MPINVPEKYFRLVMLAWHLSIQPPRKPFWFDMEYHFPLVMLILSYHMVGETFHKHEMNSPNLGGQDDKRVLLDKLII